METDSGVASTPSSGHFDPRDAEVIQNPFPALARLRDRGQVEDAVEEIACRDSMIVRGLDGLGVCCRAA